MRRVCGTIIGALVVVMSVAVPTWAASIQIGDQIKIELLENGLIPAMPDPAALDLLVVAGAEVSQGDASQIGGVFMLDNEFIDVGSTSVRFGIRGGGTPTDTGYGANARYVISDLVNPASGFITGVSFGGAGDVVGITPASIVASFTAHSVTLRLDTLQIPFTDGDFFGTIRLNLTIADVTGPGPNPVPEPATLLLVGSGAAIAWRRRRAARSLNA